MQIRLSVVRGQGSPQLLLWDAPSIQAARSRAEQAGYTVVHASSAHWRLLGAKFSLQRNHKTSAAKAAPDLLIWVEQFHALLIAGLSVIEALQTLQRQRSDDWSAVMTELESQLRQGMPLSSALQSAGRFPTLLVAMVRAAEVTSSLPQALERYLAHERRAAYVWHQVTSIALYPTLLLGIGGLVMLFLSFYVMPRFARIFQGMQGELPWTAQAMVAWSKLLQQHGPWVWGTLVLSLALLVSAALTPSIRQRAYEVLQRRSWIANRLETYHMSRWYRTTSMLLYGGIPLPESLEMATHVLPSIMQARAHEVIRAMKEGHAPGQAYSMGRMTTAVSEQLIQAGERSGDVGPMLEKAAEFHEVELTRWLERSMRVFEPIVMALIGLGIGGVVIMMYLPIFELASAIQ